MRLDAFIVELLYEHDCVVLPDFGGLVANYRSARLNRRTHIIYPPSKHVGFNRNLRNNDGLLASHVAASLSISYKEALDRIAAEVKAMNQALSNDGRFRMDRIGIFFKDRSGVLQFIPEDQENFLTASFGLVPVQLKYIEQEMPVEETPVIPISDPSRRIAAWKIAAAIAFPVLIAGSLLLRKSLAGEGHFDFASLNPFDRVKVMADYSPSESGSLDLALTPSQNPLTGALADADRTITYDFIRESVSEEGIRINPEKRNVAEPVSTAVKPASESVKNRVRHEEKQGNYALIGGAFAIEENARNFMNQLKAEGFEAALAGKKDGLQLVAYGFYSSKAEARKALQNIRQSGGHAWIRKNK